MTQSPEPISADRLERLVSGATPESEREARFAGVVRELRAGTPGASTELRERVRALPRQEAAQSGLFWSGLGGRRLALVLAPAVLFAIGAGAAVYGFSGRDGQPSAVPAAAPAPDALAPFGPAREEAGQTVAGAGGAQQGRRREDAQRAPVFGAYAPKAPADSAARSSLSGLVGSQSAASGQRVRDVSAWLRLRVANPDRLSDATNDAMRIARSLGGYVAYVDVDTTAKSGRATMTLRVPVGSVEDAMVRLSDLGTITGQHSQIVDRQVEVDRLARRIDSLRVAVARTRAALLQADDAGERARLQLLLERQRASLNRLTRQRGGIVREASFARIDLAVVTGKAAAAKDSSSFGPFGRAAGDALHFLAVAGAAALFLLIVLSPLLALGALVAVVLRSRRKRIEERLLDRLGPASRQAGEPAPGPQA